MIYVNALLHVVLHATPTMRTYVCAFWYGGIVSSYNLFESSGVSGNLGFRVRPVVSLKSDIQLSGSSESGWTIN